MSRCESRKGVCTCRQWILIIALLPVTDNLATFFITSSISGTTSFLDRIAWSVHTHTHTHVSTPHVTLEMFLTTAPLVYLEQTEGSSLARLVVDVLLGVSQKHLQLRLRDVVGFDILHQNGHGLGKRKHVTSFSIIFKPHFKEYDAFYTLKQFWTRW